MKTVKSGVTVAHSQTFLRSSRHDVSSMFASLGLMDRGRQFVVGSLQDGGRLPFQLGDHPGGDREAEQVGGQLVDLPLAEAIGPREHRQHGLEVRTKASGGDARGQGAAGRLATGRAGQAMKPILIDDRLDPGQFGDLMDHGARGRRQQAHGRSGGRPPACSRMVSRTFSGGTRGALGLAMPGLPTAFLPAGRGREVSASSRSGRTRGAWTSWWS